MDDSELLDIIEEAASSRARFLDLAQKGLTALPAEIASLTNLKILNVGRNQLSALPPQIASLVNLESLDVDGSQLTVLPPEIGRLTKLEGLFVSGNQLTTLPPEIASLVNLEALDVSNNQLTALPPEIASLTKLKFLDLVGNPLPIPPEVLQATDKPDEIINYYLKVRPEADKRRLNEAKLLMVGQGGVGKTSLVNRLVDGTFDPEEGKTEGIDIRKWQVEASGQTVRLNIWDFGGQEIMHATHQFFLTRRSLYVLVLDARQGEQDSKIDYWLKIIQSFGGDSPIIVAVNWTDEHALELDERGLRAKYPNIRAFVRTSCKTNLGIEDLKKLIAAETGGLEHIHDVLPAAWFDVKTRLESMEINYIPRSEYEKMCSESEVTDDISRRTLLGFMHDLGVVLHFDEPRLRDTNILNPEWVTRAVYRILNSKQVFESKGVLEFAQLSEILDPGEYPEDKQLFIIDMMRKFELCFDFEGHKDERFLIPDLLPKEEPDLNWDDADCLSFQYHYNVLPGSIISRFIVRIREYISRNTYWRKGVLLTYQGDRNKALVKADLDDKKIFISVTGNQRTRRDFLAIIRSNFDHIHGTIARIEAAQKVRLPDHPDVVVDYEDLLRAEERGRASYYVPKADVDINVAQLLDGIETKEERDRRREERGEGDFKAARRPEPREPVASRENPWISGSFYLSSVILLLTLLAVIATNVPWYALPIVAIGGPLAVGIIGALQLRQSGRIGEESFVKLMIESYKRLPLLKGGKASLRESPDEG